MVTVLPDGRASVMRRSHYRCGSFHGDEDTPSTMTRAPPPTIPNWPLHRKHSDRSTPTIGILSLDEPTRDRIAGIVRHVGHSHPVESWSELFNTLSTIDCVVIDVGHSELPWAAWATLTGELSVPTEIVLIVPPDLSYLRLLARVRVFAVLTSDELHTALVEQSGLFFVRPFWRHLRRTSTSSSICPSAFVPRYWWPANAKHRSHP